MHHVTALYTDGELAISTGIPADSFCLYNSSCIHTVSSPPLLQGTILQDHCPLILLFHSCSFLIMIWNYLSPQLQPAPLDPFFEV